MSRWALIQIILATLCLDVASCLTSRAQEMVPVNSRRTIGWGNSLDQLPEPIQPQSPEPEPLPRPTSDAGRPGYIGGPARSSDTIIQRYPDGRPQVTRQVMQDAAGNFLNHGIWKLFSRRGEVMAEGEFNEGLMDGTWQRWHAVGSGGLFQEAPFNQFQGPWLSMATFRNGKLDGSWTIFDRSRRKILEMPYARGKRHGRATWYYPNGLPMREVDFSEGQLHGQLVEYNQQNRRTREAVYDEGQEIITRTEWYYRDQKRSESSYLGPKAEFLADDDWWNAQPAAYETTGDEVQHGPTREWYPNGQLRLAGQYRQGLQTGSFMWWHANGQKQIEGQFVNGLKNGRWRWFHASGRKAIEGEYDKDVEIGQWTWWNEFGELEDQRDFSLESLDGLETPDNSNFGEEALPELSLGIDTGP
jgi:antitoxin component YwqK of YwqJK toxin-antitoxin module